MKPQSSYTVTVTATDEALANTIVVLIDVKDANDAPTFTDEDGNDTNGVQINPRTVTENRGSVPVGLPVAATDPDRDTLTYTVVDIPGGNDAGSFTIDPALDS